MTLTKVTELRTVLREQQKCAFRDAILDSGERLLQDAGKKTFSMLDIAHETRISVGTLYNHFRNKDDLLEALHRRVNRRLVEQLGETSDEATPRQELESFIRGSLSWLEQGGEALAATRLAPIHLPSDRSAPNAQFDEEDRQRYEQLLVERVLRVLPLANHASQARRQEFCWIFSVIVRAAIVDWFQFSRPERPSSRSHLITTLYLTTLSTVFQLDVMQQSP